MTHAKLGVKMNPNQYALSGFQLFLRVSGSHISYETHMKRMFPRSPVIPYPGPFVPRSFNTILFISYPLLFSFWSFRTQFGHFVPNLVISYLLLYFYLKLFWSFRIKYLHFRTQVISYLGTNRLIFYPN